MGVFHAVIQGSKLFPLCFATLESSSYCCSVDKLCLTLCNSMDCSMPGFPVLPYLLEFVQIYVHWVSDASEWFSCCSVMSDSLQLHGLQHDRLSCPSLSPRVCSNSCPLSWWCYLSISSSVAPFSSCPQSFPASGSFSVSQLFTSGGQSIRASASASVLPMNIQDWFSLGWTSLAFCDHPELFITELFKTVKDEQQPN